jgi:signal transduction histidine kinase
MSVRNELALGAAWRTLLPFLAALPLMGLLIWRLVGHEVRVLESAARAVSERNPNSLEPIRGLPIPDEVRPLVDSLNGLLERLGSALSQQRQFIADAAHELRTPLTALRLQLQLAERAQDAGERDKAHAMLREGIARASRVVEQLLTLAREDPEAESLLAPTDIAQVARDVAASAQAAANARGLALEVRAPAPVTVNGEATALRTLVENLVDNAIRYTPAGWVRVSARAQGSEAILEVEDTGPGIPPEERARVFDRFYRGASTAERGTGLGLAIVRRVAERHGGTVTLHAGSGGTGLRVRVALRLA